jgi:hypothetical protein
MLSSIVSVTIAVGWAGWIGVSAQPGTAKHADSTNQPNKLAQDAIARLMFITLRILSTAQL